MYKYPLSDGTVSSDKDDKCISLIGRISKSFKIKWNSRNSSMNYKVVKQIHSLHGDLCDMLDIVYVFVGIIISCFNDLLGRDYLSAYELLNDYPHCTILYTISSNGVFDIYISIDGIEFYKINPSTRSLIKSRSYSIVEIGTSALGVTFPGKIPYCYYRNIDNRLYQLLDTYINTSNQFKNNASSSSKSSSAPPSQVDSNHGLDAVEDVGGDASSSGRL